MKSVYTVVYILKSKIDNGKFDIKDVASVQEVASDATRALSQARKSLTEAGVIEANGDAKILEIRLGF